MARPLANILITNSRDAPIRHIVVRARPGHPTQGILILDGKPYPCALGRGGIGINKREGDGRTPLARMRIMSAYIRDRKFMRRSRIQLSPIPNDLGWCEVPGDRNYNRPVKIPYAVSHERMRRGDDLYDACIVLDWNIRPRIQGRGSAIFFHLARDGFTPTQGCVGISAKLMARILPRLTPQTILEVRR